VKKIIINSWEYEIIYNNYDLPKLIVKPDPSKNILAPTTLSKYYSLNHNNINAFFNNSFYVAQPDNFNDLFDFNLFAIDFSSFDFEDIERMFPAYNKQKALDLFNKDPKEHLNSIKELAYKKWIEKFGILCLTESINNYLMWAHYSDNAGFLVEFDYSKFPPNSLGPFPINYVLKKHKLNLRKINVLLGFFMESLTKKQIWDYENEYRFFFYPPNKKSVFQVTGRFSNDEFNFEKQERFISYPKEAIVKVILGFNFFGNALERLEEYQYRVNLQDNKSSMKIYLLNKLIKDEVTVELIGQNMDKYELIPIPIKITPINGTVFEIKEYRDQI